MTSSDFYKIFSMVWSHLSSYFYLLIFLTQNVFNIKLYKVQPENNEIWIMTNAPHTLVQSWGESTILPNTNIY